MKKVTLCLFVLVILSCSKKDPPKEDVKKIETNEIFNISELYYAYLRPFSDLRPKIRTQIDSTSMGHGIYDYSYWADDRDGNLYQINITADNQLGVYDINVRLWHNDYSKIIDLANKYETLLSLPVTSRVISTGSSTHTPFSGTQQDFYQQLKANNKDGYTLLKQYFGISVYYNSGVSSPLNNGTKMLWIRFYIGNS